MSGRGSCGASVWGGAIPAKAIFERRDAGVREGRAGEREEVDFPVGEVVKVFASSGGISHTAFLSGGPAAGCGARKQETPAFWLARCCRLERSRLRSLLMYPALDAEREFSVEGPGHKLPYLPGRW
jgi:hypothetical protein